MSYSFQSKLHKHTILKRLLPQKNLFTMKEKGLFFSPSHLDELSDHTGCQHSSKLLAASIFASVRRAGLTGFRKKCKPTKLWKMSESKYSGLLCYENCESACPLAFEWHQQCVVWIQFLPGLFGRAEAGGERLADPGGQPARLLPTAEWATGHHKHRCVCSGRLLTSINKPPGPSWARSCPRRVGCQQGSPIGCVYRNQAFVPKSRAGGIFIALVFV